MEESEWDILNNGVSSFVELNPTGCSIINHASSPNAVIYKTRIKVEFSLLILFTTLALQFSSQPCSNNKINFTRVVA